MPLVLESRPMEPVDFSRVFGLAELEDPSVDVTAEIEDAFKLPMVATDWRASCVRSFAVIHVVGVWTLTVQLRELRSLTLPLRESMIASLIAVDEGMSSIRSLSARLKASAEECSGRITSDSSSQD